MNQVSIIATEQGFCVRGRVSFDTAVALRYLGEKYLASTTQQQVHIDLSAITESDTACLSLLLCWMRFARSMQRTVLFINTPASLKRVQKMFNLDVLSL
jgi:ABC-type transporter Mla MlaB component